MDFDKALVEKVARVICRCEGRDPDETKPSFYDGRPIQAWLRHALTAEALIVAGLVGDGKGKRIAAVAIRAGTILATVPPPARHGHIIEGLAALKPDIFVGPEEQGFLTSDGEFVDRIEAKRIARAAGQLLERASALPELFSEDVW